MKNKILSYALRGLLVLFMGFAFSYVHADCSEECVNFEWSPEMRDACMSACKEQQQQQETQECPNGCCGIKLNTDFPIIGNCIGTENSTNVFPTMIGAITKIIMSIILVVCFILIIWAGVMRAGNKPKEGKELLTKVAITILLLGFSGVILRLINPNFFS